MTEDSTGLTRTRLDSWKEIADYLQCDVRTAMRWEQDLALPVHRFPGGQRPGVFAVPEEIDRWRETRVGSDGILVQDSTSRRRSDLTRLLLLGTLVVLIAYLAFLIAPRWQVRKQGSARTDDLVLKFPNESISFSGEVIQLPEGGTGYFVAKDLNGDTRPDLAIGGLSGKLAVLINRGNGTFFPPQYLNGCTGSSGPSVGDFDGDGHADLVVACIESQAAEIWWGDGQGNFHSATRVPVSIAPVSTFAADFNGDGIDDILVDAPDHGPLVLLRGRRDRTFVKSSLGLLNPSRPLAADFNHDGKLDIAVSCFTTCKSIWIYLNRGDGTFEPPLEIRSDKTMWDMIAENVVSGSNLDLITSTQDGTVELLAGNGDGTFQAPRVLHKGEQIILQPFPLAQQKAIFVEQVWPARLQLLRFKDKTNAEITDGGFVEGNLRFPAVADFNGDGLMDFAVLRYKGGKASVLIYLQQPNSADN